MAEILTLTVPVQPPANTTWKVNGLYFSWQPPRIQVELLGTNGEGFSHQYMGATATTLMTALNKANMTTTSLQKRVINQLLSDGVIAGTVSGSPD